MFQVNRSDVKGNKADVLGGNFNESRMFVPLEPQAKLFRLFNCYPEIVMHEQCTKDFIV